MFELNITCSKDINDIRIEFSDGGTFVGSTPNQQKEKRKKDTSEGIDEVKQHSTKISPTKQHQGFLDLDVDYGGISQEVVAKPEIQMQTRPVKVADELQNFDF